MHLPSHTIIAINLHALLETLICMNGRLGGVSPKPANYVSVDGPSISPSHDWCRVRAPLLSFCWHGCLFKLSPELCFVST
jgi:hypothetical protein